MREHEYPALLPKGFKDINEEELFKEFVSPFHDGHEYREQLLNTFNQFLRRFKALGVMAEIWIDGSFSTYAPDPADVDVVFYFNFEEIDRLPENKKTEFEKLFSDKKFMRNLYRVEVYMARYGNEDDYKNWQKIFGTFYDNITPKGIFRMHYNN